MLSPLYVHYVSEIVGCVLTKALLVGMDARDQNQLVMAALVVGQDPQAREAVMEKLQDKGDMICEIWRLQVRAVNGHNADGIAKNAVDINQFIERAKNNADRG